MSRNSPELTRPGSALGTPLVDPFISRKPIRFMPLPAGGVRIAVGDGSATSVAGVAVSDSIDLSAEQIAAGVPVALAGRVTLCLHLASDAPTSEAFGMVGDSLALEQVRRAVAQVLDLNVPVLIRGETGTGKELIARALHERGPRSRAPFMAVNLGALPRELGAAELFGAQKGSYTGATRDRDGHFRAADGGTLFLDEVGEAPPDVQVLLLRVLETGMLYPVGGSSPVAVDVRLVTATDANLEERIRQGQFKAPLLHRLAGYEVRSPPLRERREDIGLLFHHFAREELSALGLEQHLDPSDPYCDPWLPTSLATDLILHPWPGNIRQLRNVARQLVIGSRDKATLQVDLPTARELRQQPSDAAAPTPSPAEPKAATTRRRKSTEVSDAELVAALKQSAWDLKAAAELLGIPRSSIYDLIDKSPHIRKAGDLTPEEIRKAFQRCGGDVERMARELEVSKQALNRRVKELGLSGAG